MVRKRDVMKNELRAYFGLKSIRSWEQYGGWKLRGLDTEQIWDTLQEEYEERKEVSARRIQRAFRKRALRAKSVSTRSFEGAKGIAVLHHLPIFRQFFHFHKNPSSSVISGTFSRENRFPPKPKKRPKIAKHTKHEPLPKRDAISLKFP